MLGDLFSSTHEYIKSKLVNPFLGTLIFVWLVRNWYLVYSIFNFDDNFTWKDKTNFINIYFNCQDFWTELWSNFWITGALFLTSLVILAVTRYITNIYEFRILPLTYKYSESKKLVSPERFEQAREEINEKDNIIEKLRDSSSKMESIIQKRNSEITHLNTINFEAETELSSKKTEVANLNLDITQIKQKLEETISDLNVLAIEKDNLERIKSEMNENLEQEINKRELLSREFKLYDTVINFDVLVLREKVASYFKISKLIQQKLYRNLDSQELLDFSEMGLIDIKLEMNDNGGDKHPAHILTDLGLRVFEYIKEIKSVAFEIDPSIRSFRNVYKNLVNETIPRYALQANLSKGSTKELVNAIQNLTDVNKLAEFKRLYQYIVNQEKYPFPGQITVNTLAMFRNMGLVSAKSRNSPTNVDMGRTPKGDEVYEFILFILSDHESN